MAVSRDQVQIQRPCPVKLDPARAANGVRSWHCGHCDKAVHVLSNMTEGEARAFMSERAGQDVCVTYAVRKDGSIRFAPEPPPIVAPLVPIGALSRRKRVAAAVGLGVALAACTPHDNAKVARPTIVVPDTPVATPTTPTVPPQPVEPDEQLFDGELDPDPLPMVPGGMTAVPIPPDEPCDAKADKPVMKRGKMTVRGR
jgi:hypothetical protein